MKKVKSLLVLMLATPLLLASCEKTPASSGIVIPSSETTAVHATKIQLISLPEKTDYQVGEDFTIAGAKAKVEYSDGSSQEIEVTSDMCSPVDMKTGGIKTITVSYDEVTVSFDIEVHQARLQGLKIENPNNSNQMIALEFSLTDDLSLNAWNIDPNTDPVVGWQLLVETYSSFLTGDEGQKEAAAAVIGNDIFVGYYYIDGEGQRVWLSNSKGGNPLIKHKGWSGWLNTSSVDTWLPNGPDQTYIGATLKKNQTYYTSVSETSAYEGFLEEAVSSGRIYVDFAVIQNGIYELETLFLDLK